MHEAEHHAPGGHKRHFDALVASYKKFLEHSLDSGEFPLYTRQEMEIVLVLLLGARSYLSNPYFKDVIGNREQSISDSAVACYMRFILYGLKGKP